MRMNPIAKKLSEATTASAFGGEGRLRNRNEMAPTVEAAAVTHGEQMRSDEGCVPERCRSISIRQSGRDLPGQFFWDWLSGVPLGQSHVWFNRTPLLHVCDSVGGFFAGMALSYMALQLGGWWLLLLLVTLTLTVGRARKCHMTIVHQAVHDQLYQLKGYRCRKLANRLTAEVLGVLLWIPDFLTYRKAHAVSHHNPEETATPKDVDGQVVFTMRYGRPSSDRPARAATVDNTATTKDVDGKEVFALGFVPGMPREYYSALLRSIAFSPRFYLTDFWQRVHFSLFLAPWYRRVASALFLAGVLTLTWLSGGWVALTLLYLLPVFPLFKLCGLLQQLSEHMWGTHMELVGSRERLPLVCQGRFLFDPYPGAELVRGARWRALARWWLRVPYHLVVRVCVLGGDLPAHHDHHFHPRAPDWVRATQACVARMSADIEQQYSHAWSLGEALDRVFTAMSSALPLEQEWLDELKK